MSLLIFFFANHGRFQQLPFEEGLTRKGFITVLPHRMGSLTGDIEQILVVNDSRFSSRMQPENL